MENEDFNQDLKIDDKPFTLSEKKQFQEVISNFSLAQLNDAKQIIDQRIEDLKYRIQNADKIIQLMKELNISFEDMKRLGYRIPVTTKPKRVVAHSNEVYRVITESGVCVQWSGRGRKPVAFANVNKENIHLYRVQDDGLTQYEKDHNLTPITKKYR